ncbi:uncharacterized protein [Antedon mediterranea]|uniref:uncharacterized protein n=1 Tax=Antedon mediterranea TaxID=105859 RepID=UPI003AF7D2E8
MKKKKYRVPVTNDGQQYKRKNIKKDCKLISQFHVLNKELEKLKTDTDKQINKKQKMKVITKQLQEVGGIDTYQATSRLGEFKNGSTNSAKWVVRQLKEHNIRLSTPTKLRLLDVGALQLNYTKFKWIESTAIDLNPSQPGILKADFFDLKVKSSKVYDVLVLSLVLNFVGMPHRRGEMLKKCAQVCKQMGYLIIVLPLACVTNSRYLTHDHLIAILDSIGFTLITSHNSRKLSYKMFQLTKESTKTSFKKQILNNGTKCNNFSIVVR